MLGTALAAALSFAQTDKPAAPKPSDPATGTTTTKKHTKKHRKNAAKKATDTSTNSTSAPASNAPAKK